MVSDTVMSCFSETCSACCKRLLSCSFDSLQENHQIALESSSNPERAPSHHNGRMPQRRRCQPSSRWESGCQSSSLKSGVVATLILSENNLSKSLSSIRDIFLSVYLKIVLLVWNNPYPRITSCWSINCLSFALALNKFDLEVPSVMPNLFAIS